MRIMAASSRQAAGILLLLLVVTVPTAQGRSRKQIVELVNVSIDNILANLNKLHGIVITAPNTTTTPAVTTPTTTAAVLSTTTTAAGPETTTTTAVPTTTTTEETATETSEAPTTTEETATETSVAPTTTEETPTETSVAPTTTEETPAETSVAPTTTEETATETSVAPTTTEETPTETSVAPTTTEETPTETSVAPTTTEETATETSVAPTTTPNPTNAITIRRRVRSLRQTLDEGSSGSGPLETWRRLEDEGSTVNCKNDTICLKLVSALDDVDEIVSEINDDEINDGQVGRAENADKDVEEVVNIAQTDPALQALLNDNIGYIESEIESIKEDKKDIQDLFDNLKSKETLGIVLGSIAGALVLIGLVGAGYFFYQKRRKNAVPKDSTYEG